jgi:predicted tellurium resistance membrane protein TerC
MDWITEPSAWIAFGTLTLLEVVLGIDNVIFISILAGKLPTHQRERARIVGLALAMIMRVLLLLVLSYIVRLTAPLFEVLNHEISGRDLILIGGGLFLLFKSTYEIHDNLEGEHGEKSRKVAASFASVIIQILLLDLVFSLDSVITAVGMVDELGVMIAAVIVAIGFMLLFSGYIARFVEKHPTIKMLALSFLILIGVTLIAEGFGQHISKGYIYFAMGFSIGVEVLNIKMRARTKPVDFHSRYAPEGGKPLSGALPGRTP